MEMKKFTGSGGSNDFIKTELAMTCFVRRLQLTRMLVFA